jgi:hypothetical protein
MCTPEWQRHSNAAHGEASCCFPGCPLQRQQCPGHLGFYELTALHVPQAPPPGGDEPAAAAFQLRDEGFCCLLQHPLLRKEFQKKLLERYCSQALSCAGGCACDQRCIDNITTKHHHIFRIQCSKAAMEVIRERVPPAFARFEVGGHCAVSVLGLHYLFSPAGLAHVAHYFTDTVWLPGRDTQQAVGLSRKIFHGRKRLSLAVKFADVLGKAFTKAAKERSFKSTCELAALLVSFYGGRDMSAEAVAQSEQKRSRERDDLIKICHQVSLRSCLARLFERPRYPQYARMLLQNGAHTWGNESEPVAGVSLAAAMGLVAEMHVGPASLVAAMRHFRRGPLQYPGCHYAILKGSGQKVWLRARKTVHKFQPREHEAAWQAFRKACWAEVKVSLGEDGGGFRRVAMRTDDPTFQDYNEQKGTWDRYSAEDLPNVMRFPECRAIAVVCHGLVLEGLGGGGGSLVLETEERAEAFLNERVLVLGRHLVDGDSLTATRSPFDSAQSMMTFPVKVLFDSWCCKLPCIIMPPIDGDFDGDTVLWYKVLAKDAAAAFDAQTPAALLCYRNGSLAMGAVLNGIQGLHYLASSGAEQLVPPEEWAQVIRCFPSYRPGLERHVRGGPPYTWADAVSLAVLSTPCNGRWALEVGGAAQEPPFMPTVYSRGSGRAALQRGLYVPGEPIVLDKSAGAWHRQLAAQEYSVRSVMAVLTNLQSLGALYAFLRRSSFVSEQLFPRPALASAQDAVLAALADLRAEPVPWTGLPSGFGQPAVLPGADDSHSLLALVQRLTKLVIEPTWRQDDSTAVVDFLSELADGMRRLTGAAGGRELGVCGKVDRAVEDLQRHLKNQASQGRPRSSIAADLESKQKLQLGAINMCCSIALRVEDRALVEMTRRAVDGQKTKAAVELTGVVRACTCAVTENLRQDEPFGHLWGPRLRTEVCVRCFHSPRAAAGWRKVGQCRGGGASCCFERDVLWLAAYQVPLTLFVQPCLAVAPAMPSRAPPPAAALFARRPTRDRPGPLRITGEVRPTKRSVRTKEIMKGVRTAWDEGLDLEGMREGDLAWESPYQVPRYVEPVSGELMALHAALQPVAMVLFSAGARQSLITHGWPSQAANLEARLLWTSPPASVPIDTAVAGRTLEPRRCEVCDRVTEHRLEHRGALQRHGRERRIVQQWICARCGVPPGDAWPHLRTNLYPPDLQRALAVDAYDVAASCILRVELDPVELLRLGVTALHASLLTSRFERDLVGCKCHVLAWDAPGLQRDEVVLLHLTSADEQALLDAFLQLRQGSCGLGVALDDGGPETFSVPSSKADELASAQGASVVGAARCSDDYPALLRLEGVNACTAAMVRDICGSAASAYGGALLLAAARCADGWPVSVASYGKRCGPMQQMGRWGSIEPLSSAAVRQATEDCTGGLAAARLTGAHPRMGLPAVDLFTPASAGLPPGLGGQRRDIADDVETWPVVRGGILSPQQRLARYAARAVQRTHGKRPVRSSVGDDFEDALDDMQEEGDCPVEVLAPHKRQRIVPRAAWTALPRDRV